MLEQDFECSTGADECHSPLQSDEDKVDNDFAGLENSVSTERERDRLSVCLSIVGFSPLKFHSQS